MRVLIAVFLVISVLLAFNKNASISTLSVLFLGRTGRRIPGTVHVWSVQQEGHKAGSNGCSFILGIGLTLVQYVPVRLWLEPGTVQGCRKPAAESGIPDQCRRNCNAAFSDRGSAGQRLHQGKGHRPRGKCFHLLCTGCGKEGLSACSASGTNWICH